MKAEAIAPSPPAAAGPSQALAAFAADTRYVDIPQAVLERARIHILDGVGLALASTTFPFAGPTLAAVRDLSGSAGSCTVIGSTATPSASAGSHSFCPTSMTPGSSMTVKLSSSAALALVASMMAA